MAEISEFIANVAKRGLAAPNRFMVEITFPQQIRNPLTEDYFAKYNISQNDAFRVSMFCETTALPSKSIQALEDKEYGPVYKMPYEVSYGDLPMTFYVGTDMKEKYFFDAWQNMIINPNTHDMNYYREYVSSVRIFQLDQNEERTYSVELKNAWPISIGDMSLAQTDANTFHRIPVTFTYQKWVSEPVTTVDEVKSIQDLLINAGPISNKLQSKLFELKRQAISKINKNNIFHQQTVFDLF